MIAVENVSLKIHTEKLFGELFAQDDVTEIVVNRHNEIWYESSQGWCKGDEEQNIRVSRMHCEDFANSLAAFSKQKLDSSNPILGTTLPNGARVQIIIPPACDSSQFSITVRKPSKKNFSLNDFKNQGFFDDIIKGESDSEKLNRELTQYLDNKDFIRFFELAVASGKKNLVIAGETGSGKTTFMKSLIDSIPENERLITIEDVRELFLVNHHNFVNLLYPSEGNNKKVTAATLLKSCLRMKPDRILLAELRSGEAFDYINVITSGHGGSITSVHAGSTEEVIQRITLMTLQNETGSTIPYETVKNIISSTIDIIVHVTRDGGVRRIDTLFWKDYYKGESHA